MLARAGPVHNPLGPVSIGLEREVRRQRLPRACRVDRRPRREAALEVEQRVDYLVSG